MKMSVLAKLRQNINAGKIGCIDLSFPQGSMATEKRHFQFLEKFLDRIALEGPPDTGACLVSIPQFPGCETERKRGIKSFVCYCRMIQKHLAMPLILDAGHCHSDDSNAVRGKLAKCDYIVVRKNPDGGLAKFVDLAKKWGWESLVYYFIPKMRPPGYEKNSSSDPEDTRQKDRPSDLKDIRKALGEEAIILIAGYNRKTDMSAFNKQHKGVMGVINEPGSIFYLPGLGQFLSPETEFSKAV